ncbi:MAG TPA: hypothetical protein PKL77_09190 [Candidatus Omnitrophota bacterium]|nr:hypothetical protein [Candidatus Omnitrophota bacterium]HPT06914.1 hypothetical protein [Candidatus Omnitrophota bacterium]
MNKNLVFVFAAVLVTFPFSQALSLSRYDLIADSLDRMEMVTSPAEAAVSSQQLHDIQYRQAVEAFEGAAKSYTPQSVPSRQVVSQQSIAVDKVEAARDESVPADQALPEADITHSNDRELPYQHQQQRTVAPEKKQKTREEVIDETLNSYGYISAGFNGNYMHYRELDGKDTLDKDFGYLNGYYVTAGFQSQRMNIELLGKPFIEGYYRQSENRITYDGAASNGITSYPFRDDDQLARVVQYGAKIGGVNSFGEKGQARAYFDVGHRTWTRGENRVVNNVLEYAEKYYWTYFGLGGGLSYYFTEKLSAGFDAELMFSSSSLAKMRADLYEGGTFALRHVWGSELKFPIKYQILKHVSIDVTPYFTYWHIKNSLPLELSGSYFYEPDSNTHVEGLLAGLTYSF